MIYLITNFIVAGSKGIGKSFLINKILKCFNIEYSGFKTLPYKINGVIKGHYFHSLVNVLAVENDLPFTLRHEKNNCIAIRETFDILGIPYLKESLSNNSKIVILDEIGTCETNNLDYLQQIVNIFDSNKVVLIALKKVDAKHILKLKTRSDCFVLDLDSIPIKTAIKIIKPKLMEVLK